MYKYDSRLFVLQYQLSVVPITRMFIPLQIILQASSSSMVSKH